MWRKVVLYLLVAVMFGAVSALLEGCPGRRNPVTSRYVKVNYTIWDQLGEDPAHFSAGTEVVVLKGATFYDVMQLAALADDTFRFEWENFSGHPGLVGHFIVSIDGRKHVPADKIYWFIYQTPGAPDPAKPPGDDLLTRAVDYIFPSDGNNYLFWRRKSTGVH